LKKSDNVRCLCCTRPVCALDLVQRELKRTAS